MNEQQRDELTAMTADEAARAVSAVAPNDDSEIRSVQVHMIGPFLLDVKVILLDGSAYVGTVQRSDLR